MAGSQMSTGGPYSPTFQHYTYAPYPTPGNPYPAPPLPAAQSSDERPIFPDNGIPPGGQIPGEKHSSRASSGTDGKARLRRACDSCSVRKVKCDENTNCRPCLTLGLECKRDRPSRRRGPPNRHAEAMKKQRLESPTTPGQSASSSPTHAAQMLASFAQQQVLSAESICPFSLLELLIDDYFAYIHPLIPVPHEPSFREALSRREDLSNPTFLALLASMIGCLVASFPRKPRQHLKAQHKQSLFPNSMSLVERCHKVAVEARGAGYLDKELVVYDAAISYLQAITGAYIFNWRQCKLYMSECMTILRSLGLQKNPIYNRKGSQALIPGSLDYAGPQGPGIDLITREIGNRLFWVVFVGIKTFQQLGMLHGEIFLPPASTTEPYPPLPIEVDDLYIYPDTIVPQPPGVISELVGFNANVRVFSSYNALSSFEMAYGMDEIFDWTRQKREIEQCLRNAKVALEKLPWELILCPDNPNGGFGSRRYEEGQEYRSPIPGFQHSGDASQYPPLDNQGLAGDRKRIQFEIQKANIYVSQLGTRSYLVEKYWNLHDTHKGMNLGNDSSAGSPGMVPTRLDTSLPSGGLDLTDQEMAEERENIFRDLFTVLGMISQVSMEPNGGSFIHKVRLIASTLLDVPRERKGQVAMHAEQYLGALLEVLMKLERVLPGSGNANGSDGGEDEEAELRHWADLREYQTRFINAGGLLNEL